MGQIENFRKEKDMDKYYALETKNRRANLYIFGSITSYPWREKDRDAYGVVKELQELDVDEIHVHINSTGGSVAEALAIYNVLRESDFAVTTYCDGFACSAASVVFMAGDERIMSDASLLMIHNAWTYASGNAAQLRKQAEDLDKITQASVNAYMRRATISEEEVKKLMDEETWISASEAKTYGFATKIVEEEQKGFNQSAMNSIKEKLLATPVEAILEAVTFDAKAVAAEILSEIENRTTNKPENSWSSFFSGKGE